MTMAIRVHQFGGPEVLQWEKIEVPAPGPTEVTLRHTAIGLNYIDVYGRTGIYPMALPGIPGSEAAGVVEAVGKKVRGLKVGDRVAYMQQGTGAYCERRTLSAEILTKLPTGISDEQAAALLLKGFTAYYLLRLIFKVKRGDWALIPAAAGGVGLILCQWAKHLGAKVIGVVSTPDKAKLAKRNGCAHVLLSSEDIPARVKAITRGRGVDVAYDGVGKDTFFASLDSLRPRGMMVTFGNASGVVPPIAPLELSKRGSLFLTRPTTKDYVSTPDERRQAAKELFALVKKKVVKIQIGQRYALRDAAAAHRDLEARKTVGSTILAP